MLYSITVAGAANRNDLVAGLREGLQAQKAKIKAGDYSLSVRRTGKPSEVAGVWAASGAEANVEARLAEFLLTIAMDDDQAPSTQSMAKGFLALMMGGGDNNGTQR